MAPLTNRLLAVKYQIGGLGIVPTDSIDATTKFEKYLSQIIGVLTIVAVIYFVVQIIFAGYTFISSTGDVKNMEAARKRLIDSVLGLFIVVVALGFGSLLAKLLGLGSIFNLQQMFTNMGL